MSTPHKRLASSQLDIWKCDFNLIKKAVHPIQSKQTNVAMVNIFQLNILMTGYLYLVYKTVVIHRLPDNGTVPLRILTEYKYGRGNNIFFIHKVFFPLGLILHLETEYRLLFTPPEEKVSLWWNEVAITFKLTQGRFGPCEQWGRVIHRTNDEGVKTRIGISISY